MKEYLKHNKRHFEKGYFAPNVESLVFRFYGIVLKPDFGMSGADHEGVLDFGCGQGAAVNFFHGLGFEAYGVDMSETDITAARQRYGHIRDRFAVIDPQPRADDRYFERSFDLVIAIKSLYYLSDEDMAIRLGTLHAALRPGGVFFADMIGTQSEYFAHSEDAGGGLRKVTFQNTRIRREDYFVNFTESEDDLIRKFSMFQPRHIGFHSDKYRSDAAEGVTFHHTFVGVKE